jgi:hypothetical protein
MFFLQIDQASFVYWFFGTGWADKVANADEQHTDAPTKKAIARCDGPDAGYVATSACVLCAALTLIQDKDDLPKE